MADNTVNTPIESSHISDEWRLITSLLDNNELEQFRHEVSSSAVLLSLYNRLCTIDTTLPANLPTATEQPSKTPLVCFKEAFEKIQARQQQEIAYLIQYHPAIMATPEYAAVLQQNTSVTLQSLEAKHAFLDGINSEIITARIDIDSPLLDLDNTGITRLPVTLFKTAGDAHFWQNLTHLYCCNNQLIALNVTELKALQRLECNNNQLTKLNLQQLVGLEWLCCNNNQLTELNVQGLVKLQRLECNNNQLTELNVERLTELHTLDCGNNQLAELNVQELVKLQSLCCNNNQLAELNVERLTALHTLSCGNNQLAELNVQRLAELQKLECNNNQLAALNVQGLTALHTLGCGNNQLAELDVQELVKLQWLCCNNNQLAELNVERLTALHTLDCRNNKLAELNVQKLVKLQWLGCNNNQLTELKVQGLAALHTLGCDNNQLAELNVQGLAALHTLGCGNNQLTELNLKGLAALQKLECNNSQLSDLNLTDAPAAIKNKHAELERSLLFKKLSQANSTEAMQAIIVRLGADYTYKNRLYYCPAYTTKLFMTHSANTIYNLASSTLSSIAAYLRSFGSSNKTSNARPRDNTAELARGLLFQQLNQADSTEEARQATIASLGADYTYKNCLYYCPVYGAKLLMNDSADQVYKLTSSALSSVAAYLPSAGASNNTPNPQQQRALDERQVQHNNH